MVFYAKIKEKALKVLGKKGIFLAVFLLVILALFAIFLLIKNPFIAKTDSSKIGWISDIHADRFKRRSVDSGTVYPRQYKDYLPKVFDEMKKEGVGVVVTTGDNTNSGDDNYANDLKKIAKEKNMNVVWIKGNHDDAEVMDILVGKNENRYYYKDIGNVRIIGLDDTVDVQQTGDYTGGIDNDQIEWLRGLLKTDKQVIVTMHIPIFSMRTEDSNIVPGSVLEKYSELEKLLQESGNVKMVLSGHWHVPWQKTYNGIKYYGGTALTYEGYEGAYAIIDLDDNSVNYLFAK